MEINNDKFVDAIMTLMEQSREDREFLEGALSNYQLPAPFRIRFEHMKSTLVTFEEVVREMSEQQMQIQEGLDKLNMDFLSRREENPPSDET